MPDQLLTLSCREVAASLSPATPAPPGVECDFCAQGETFEEIMEQCAKHATEQHGWHSFPPEMWSQMRKLVKTVQV